MPSNVAVQHGKHKHKKSLSALVSLRSCCGLVVVLWLIGLGFLVLKSADWSRYSSAGSGEYHDIHDVHIASYKSQDALEYRNKVSGLDYKLYDHDQKSFYEKKDEHVHSPAVYRLRDLLDDWNPDDVSEEKWTMSRAHPDQKDRGGHVRRFNFGCNEDMELARKYREAEVPFIVYNVSALLGAAAAFSVDELLANFGSMPRLVERSDDNHFMYYTIKRLKNLLPSEYVPPQIEVPMTFSKFLRLAEDAEKVQAGVSIGKDNTLQVASSSTSQIAGGEALHYMTIPANEGGRTKWITDALPIFDPQEEDNFFLVDSSQYRGINCRFGMKGIAAAAHYDSHRNFISMIRGRKRYILLPPSECPNLKLLSRGHPSARHSSVDWSDPTAVERAGKLGDSLATEAVVSMGDVLYVPSFWFHYIVSQDASVQCNARSGYSPIGAQEIKECGVMDKGDKGDDKTDVAEGDNAGAGAEQGEVQSNSSGQQHSQWAQGGRIKNNKNTKKRLRKGRNKEAFRKASFHMEMEN